MWLAESYSCSTDALACTLKLRRGVTFSDGAPFTSADVVFSFQAAYRREDGQPARRRAPCRRQADRHDSTDAQTVVLGFPSVFGPGPAIAGHAADPAEAQAGGGLQGRHAAAAVGPGHACRRHRRPRAVRQSSHTGPASASSWRAIRSTGARTRRARRCRISTASRSTSRPIRMPNCCACSRAGRSRRSGIQPRRLRRAETRGVAGKLSLVDAGLAFDADAFWFNLKPGAKAHDGRPWLSRVELRRARLARREPAGVRRQGVPRLGRAAVSEIAPSNDNLVRARRAPSIARPTTWAAHACCSPASACATRIATVAARGRRGRAGAVSRSSRRRATRRSRRGAAFMRDELKKVRPRRRRGVRSKSARSSTA